ncbi:MAG: site-2 protease family protein [Candidatus Woesearchaeota archaeon]
MNIDLISILVFYGILLLIFTKYRHKFEVQNKIFVLYKTKLGLKLMDRIAKAFPRFLNVVSYVSIGVGIAGMVAVFLFLVKETLKFMAVPGTLPPLAPVLPGVSIPGAPALSFWHWILAIFFVAMVHEFSHGVFARLHKLKVKSSGFAFLGPILAAFVEPDEKQINKASLKKQLSVFSAGPFINIVFGIIFLLLLIFVMAPVQQGMFVPGGIVVGEVLEGYPLSAKGLNAPFMMESINGQQIRDANDFFGALGDIKPGERIILGTNQGYYNIVAVPNPENSSKGFIGMAGFTQKLDLADGLKQHQWVTPVFMWLALFVTWLFIINIGVGMFNLMPLGPVDGGKILYSILVKYIPNKMTAKKIWLFVSYVSLVLLIINLLPWVWKAFVAVGQGVAWGVAYFA